MDRKLIDLHLVNRYLNLLESAITGVLYEDHSIEYLSEGKYDLTSRVRTPVKPRLAQTMMGAARMRNLRQLCETVILNDVPGDFIEAGVWRGGGCIFMRGILDAYDDKDRRVFLADSFQGFPEPNPTEYPADDGDTGYRVRLMKVSRDDVADSFRRYGLLDDRVVFLEGWFKDVLPQAPIDKISILRLDGDMYESTSQALNELYHKVSLGGFVIVNDYALKTCAEAVDQFRAAFSITSPLMPVDDWSVWWRVDHPPIAPFRL